MSCVEATVQGTVGESVRVIATLACLQRADPAVLSKIGPACAGNRHGVIGVMSHRWGHPGIIELGVSRGGQQRQIDLAIGTGATVPAGAEGGIVIAIPIDLGPNGAVDAISVKSADAETKTATFGRARYLGTRRDRVVSPKTRMRVGPDDLITASSENLDDTTNRFRSIQARARPAHDLDALDLIQGQKLESRGTDGGRIQFDSVYQCQHVPGVSAAQKNAGILTVTTITGHLEAGLPCQQFT